MVKFRMKAVLTTTLYGNIEGSRTMRFLEWRAVALLHARINAGSEARLCSHCPKTNCLASKCIGDSVMVWNTPGTAQSVSVGVELQDVT